MAGVRIQHPTERNVTYTLVDGSRPYVTPITCPTCLRVHVHKTYHLALDAAGAAIVSHEVLDRLRRLPLMGGFRVTNGVERPPAQLVGVGGSPLIRPTIVPHPQLKEPT